MTLIGYTARYCTNDAYCISELTVEILRKIDPCISGKNVAHGLYF